MESSSIISIASCSFEDLKKRIARAIEKRWAQFARNRIVGFRTSEDIATDILTAAWERRFDERTSLALLIYRAGCDAKNALRMERDRTRFHKAAAASWKRSNDAA